MSTYVMSDLHGQYELYLRMLKMISFHSKTDHLYIVGDVIDRGPDGVALIEDCMQRQGVTLFLGNHEDIFLHYLQARHSHHLTSIWHKHWMQNGGKPTKKEFFSRPISKQQAIEVFLKTCPLQKTLSVGGRLFLVAHACPLNMTETEYNRHRKQLECRRGACLPSYRDFLLWQRIEKEDVFPENVTVLFGHTPTCHYQNDLPLRFWKYRNLIDLDCGLAGLPVGNTDARLGCLRLEDMQEFYLSP